MDTQYKFNSIDDFANSIKQQYPVYQNLDNKTLTDKIVAKYPVYQSQIKPPTSTYDTAMGKGDTRDSLGVKKTLQDYSKAPSNFIKEAGKSDSSTNKNPLIKTAENALGATASGIGTVFAPLTNAIKGMSDKFANSDTGNTIEKNPAMGKILDLIGGASNHLNDWSQAHPEAARNLTNALTVGLSAVGEKPITDVANDITKGAKDFATKTADVVNNTGEKIKETLPSGQGKAQVAKGEELQNLKERISPKPTVKEAKLALEQGRLVKGKDATFFKNGTPDQVLTNEQQLKSVNTIDRLLPDHTKMSDPELYTSLKEKVGETANNLKPEMEKVKINPQTVKNITDQWNKVKAEQKASPYTPSDVNIKKLQSDFESRLQKSKSGNMNDLWETRKAYDDSVPDNVKSATSQSSESLQVKKEVWLQNRRILNAAINDSGNGLGETSRQAFSDMTDMYEAQNGIKSKANINTKIEPAGIKKIIKPIIKAGAKATGLGAGLHLIP